MNSLVIKISGEYFKTKKEGLLSESKAIVFSNALKKIEKLYTYIFIIIGGGNLIRGRKHRKNVVPRHIYDELGMNFTNINCQWLSSFLNEKGHTSIALTTGINTFISSFSKYFNSFNSFLPQSKIRIILIGGGTTMPYLSTDTLTIITALRTKSNLVLFAKYGIDGVYTCDPTLNKNAEFIKKTNFQSIIDRKLAFIDISGAMIALNSNITLKVFRFEKENDFLDVLNGSLKHTYIS